MKYAKVCIVFCSFVLLCGAVKVAEEEEPIVVQLLAAGENSQAETDLAGNRKVRQYFGPPPPPYFGPPPPPYYGGGGFGGFGGGYAGYGFQRTRVVTRTRVRGGFGGFGGGYYG